MAGWFERTGFGLGGGRLLKKGKTVFGGRGWASFLGLKGDGCRVHVVLYNQLENDRNKNEQALFDMFM